MYQPYMKKSKPLSGGLSLKVNFLKIGPLKVKLNIRTKIIFVVNFIKRNGKNSAQI